MNALSKQLVYMKIFSNFFFLILTPISKGISELGFIVIWLFQIPYRSLRIPCLEGSVLRDTFYKYHLPRSLLFCLYVPHK